MNDNRDGREFWRGVLMAIAYGCALAVIAMLVLGCASDCTVRHNGYCYHVEGL